MVPWRFLLPGLCLSGLRLPEEGSGDGGGDCNGNLQGKFPGKIEDSIGLPDIPAGRKMPGFAVCRDLADSPGNLWMSYNSVQDLGCGFSIDFCYKMAVFGDAVPV